MKTGLTVVAFYLAGLVGAGLAALLIGVLFRLIYLAFGAGWLLI